MKGEGACIEKESNLVTLTDLVNQGWSGMGCRIQNQHCQSEVRGKGVGQQKHVFTIFSQHLVHVPVGHLVSIVYDHLKKGVIDIGKLFFIASMPFWGFAGCRVLYLSAGNGPPTTTTTCSRFPAFSEGPLEFLQNLPMSQHMCWVRVNMSHESGSAQCLDDGGWCVDQWT